MPFIPEPVATHDGKRGWEEMLIMVLGNLAYIPGII